MRVSNSFWTSLTVLLALFLAVATNAFAFNISGTVANSTTSSGRIYLNVQWSMGGSTGYGVSIPSAGAYTIRGVQNGTYTVQAFMDTQVPEGGTRHASDPIGQTTVTVNGADVSSVNLTLSQPATPVLQSPQGANAMGGDGLAFVMWDPAYSDTGAESSRYYTIYWSNTPNPGPANYTGKSADLPSTRNGGYLVRGLTNGNSYYFAVTARLAAGSTESAPTNANNGQAVAIGTPSGGYTVSGTVDSTGIAKTSTTPLWVAVVVPDKGPIGFSYIANPSDLQSFSVAGVAPGTYQVYSILDMNNDGLIDIGDYMSADAQAPTITVGSANVTGVNVSLPAQATTVAVGTNHSLAVTGGGYSLNLRGDGEAKLAVNMAVTGPQLATIDIAASEDGGGSFRAWPGVINRPQLTDSYSFNVTYADGTSASLSANVLGVLDSAATPVAPTPGSSVDTATPTFTWSAPSTPPATPYYYSVSVDGNGTHWESDKVPQGQLSVTYGSNGGAAPLAPGNSYNWQILVKGSPDNTVQGASSSFTVSSIASSANGSYTYDAASGNLAMNWSNSNFVCEGPQVGAETKTVSTLNSTTMTWSDGMSWTRSGTGSGIVGTWTTTDPNTNNSYTAIFNGDGTVSVTATVKSCGNNGGTGSAMMSGFSPMSGAPGTQVTITGSGFGQMSTSSSVSFNGQVGQIISWSDTQIVAQVPSNASGSGPINVMTGSGITLYSNSMFTVNSTGTGNISFSGAVNDLSNAAVSGATVGVVGNSSLSTSTGTDGSFTIGGIPASTPFTVQMSKTGYVTIYTPEMSSTGPITSSAPFTFYQPTDLSGIGIVSGKGAIKARVVDANLNTNFISGAVVTANSQNHPNAPYNVLYYDGTTWGGTATYGNGVYLVPNVDDGDTVTVSASKAGWTFYSRTFHTVADAVSEGRIQGTMSSTTSPGVISVNPSALTFSDNGTGTFPPQAITFTNVGSGNLTVQSSSLSDNTNFSIQPGGTCPQLPTTFAPNQSCTLMVGFNPTVSGTLSATLAVNSDDPKTPTLSIGLTGSSAQTGTFTGAVSGTVTNSAGAGVGNVDVQIFDTATGFSRGQVYTDPMGNYNVGGLPSGSYKAQFSYLNAPAVWYQNASTMDAATAIQVTAPNTATGINVALPVFNVSGHLFDGSGNGVCGAHINASNTTGSAYATTAADGSYSISLPAGTYTFSMNYYPGESSCGTGATSYPQYYAPSTSVTVNGNTSYNFSLPPVYNVSGKVLDGSGMAVSNANLNFSSSSPNGTGTSTAPPPFFGNATSGTDGSYSLQLYPSTYGVNINWNGMNMMAERSLTVSGNLSRDFTWKNPPTVTGFSPTSGSAGTQVTVTGTGFGSSATGNSVNLNGMYAPVVSWSDTQIVFTVPSGAMTGNIYVNAGGNMAGSSSTFTVIQLPPKVVHTVPAQNATGMPANGGIYVDFDSPMDFSSVNAQTFTLQDATGASIAGTVKSNSDSIVFVPTSALDFGKTYTATLTTGVKGSNGMSLAAPYTWSFTTAQSASNTFSLQGGVYSLDASNNGTVTNYFYDQVKLATDGSHLTQTFYAYDPTTGTWGISTTSGNKNGYYTLTDSGWQLGNDSPSAGTVAQNSDGSFTWTNTLDGTQQSMVPVEYNLAGAPLATYAEPKQLPAPPTGNFPDGSMGYIFRQTQVNDSYQVNIWTSDPSMPDQNYLRYMDSNMQQQTVTSLSDVPTIYATGQTTNYLYGPVQNLGMQFAQGGSLLFFQSGSTGMTQLTTTGSWEMVTVKGQQLLLLHLPSAFAGSMEGEAFYAQVNGVVKQGEKRPAGTTSMDSHPNYNQTALYWMTNQSLPSGPAAQTIVFSAAPAITFGGSGKVSASGGASGNPVTFTSTTPAVCSVSGSTVTALTVGTCTIAADQAGNSSYLAAAQVTQDIVIGKANQKIGAVSFNPASVKLGGSTTVSAAAGASTSPVTFASATPKVCSVSGSSVTAIALGDCNIVASQAGDANYNDATPVTGTISVGSTVPGAPTAVQATAGNGQALVSFTAPSNGGSAITGYTVTATPGNITASGSASPILISGLTNGTSYTFTVTASNANGSGQPSAASSAVTPAGNVPGAPVIGLALGGNGSATVSFSAPATNGGSAITGFTVTSNPAGGVDSNAGSTGMVHVVTGLANGTSYTFTVTASNASGTSAPSAPSNSVTPVTVPGAPTNVSASVDHGMATVSFSPPSFDGGSMIYRYTVTSTPGNITAAGFGSPVTVMGLTDGTSYSFTVTATSAAGTSAPSAPSTSVTPTDTMAPVVLYFSLPGSVSAADSATSTQAQVLGLYAKDNAAVAGYMITTSSVKPGADDSRWSPTIPSSAQLSATPGEHVLYAWAKDAAGNVSYPFSATVVVTAVDTTPPKVLAGPALNSITNNSAVIEWVTNEDALGGVTYASPTTPETSVNEGGDYTTRHSVTLNALAPDTTYTLSVTATDRTGNGPIRSNILTIRTKPAPDTTAPYIIQGPAISAIGPDTATVQWWTNEPAQGQVSYGTTNSLGQGVAETGFVTAHTVTVTGLSAQTTYYLKVSATDVAGNGPRESAIISFTTVALPDTTPPALIGSPMVVNTSDTGATVIWATDKASTSTVITYDGANYALASDNTLSNLHLVTVTGLNASTTYSYKVSSTDGHGNSMITDYKTFSTLAAPDTTAPVIIEGPLVAAINSDSAVIRWNTDEPSDSVIEYGTSDSFGSSVSQTTLQRTHNLTLTGLAAGTTYYFRVGSTDAYGNGPTNSQTFTLTTSQDASYKVPVITVPPTVLYVTDTSMTIYWETDDPSDSVIRYGEGDTLTQQVSSSDKVNKHQLTITNLKKSTSYRIQVSSTNMSGNTVYAQTGSAGRHLAYNLDAVYSDASGSLSLGNVTTASQADVTPPVITVAPAATGITDKQATITWTTDEIADSQVSYGPQGGALTLSAGDNTAVTSHVMVLTNLTPSTQYQFQVGSTDPSGNGPTQSTVLTFTTAATPDTTPPSFQGNPALVISYQDGTGKTTIGWNTDEVATTQIKYGTSASALTSQSALPGLTQAHALTLALQPGTTYYAAAVAIDSSGNVAQSTPLQFTTLGSSDTTAPTTSASPAAGTYLGDQSITLSTDKPAVIYYTTDGSAPSTSSPQYNGPIVLSASKTLKFFAVDAAGNKESAHSAAYVIQRSVSAASSDTNGTISCPSAANTGETAVCTLIPNTGFQPASASGCGGTLSGTSFTTGAITQDCSVTASFTPIMVGITPTVAGNGSIFPATVQSVSYGSNSSFTVTPADGFQVASVTGCGGTLDGTTYTTGSVSSACTVTATFMLPGDVNNDGVIDVADALQALQISAGLISATPDTMARADVGPLVDGKPKADGKVDITDVLLILKKAVGVMLW